jgi:hypothetical protein
MGRPPIFKKGAQTSAERQRRYRKRLRRDAREAEIAAKRESNHENRLHREAQKQETAEIVDWHRAYKLLAERGPPLPDNAEEIAFQVAECIKASGGEMTVDDIRDALDRRFGPREDYNDTQPDEATIAKMQAEIERILARWLSE